VRLLMRYSFEEFVNRSGISSELVLSFVSHSWIMPADREKMIFDQEDLARVKLIYELQSVMGINDEGIPVILHLVDQLNRIHIEIKTRIIEKG
jgi:chaperone modulatory protein CbpM